MAHLANSPVIMGGNNVNPGSQSNISDLDEEFDTQKVMTHEMYDTKNPIITGKYLANAEVAAFHTVERLLNNVANIMHEKYINSKLDGHTIESTYDLVEVLFNTEFITFDHNAFVDSVDEEPNVTTIDNWGRSKIPSKKITKIDAKNEFTDHAESLLSEDRKALQKAKDVGKKLIKDVKGENVPAPLDLQEPVEMNKTEDDLRQVKERERKRQDEEKALEIQKRKAENQSKFKQGNADLKKKPFTYDYNGVPIIINNAKVEKFPPSAYLVQHAVHDPEVENTEKKKKKQPKDVAVVKVKQKKVPDTEQEFVKKYGLGVPTYDILEPQVGVTYFEGGKTKNSNKNRFNMTSATTGALISTLGNNPRLTKTEYLQLTKGGNLSRTNVGDKDATMNATAKTNLDSKKLLDPNASKNHWDTKTGSTRDIHANTTGNLRMMQGYREPDEGIKVDPSKMMELLKASQEIEQDWLKAPKQMVRNDKFNTDDSLKRSPIDTFNLELLNSREWGKSNHQGNMNSLPKLPNHQRFEHSLGKNAKLPRYRANTTSTTHKNYEELLMETLKSQQIA